MTRRLIKQYLQSPSGEEGEQNDWRKWLMNETIRRTVFLVNAINTLSCRIQKQDPYYFEPLDDNLIRDLTLPAPEAVWKASSAEEWIAAKSQLGSDDLARSRLTIRQSIERISHSGGHGGNQFTGIPQDSNSGALELQVEKLDDFTRLVIATVDVQ